jgi:hypothetical protein
MLITLGAKAAALIPELRVAAPAAGVTDAKEKELVAKDGLAVACAN